MLFRIEFLLKLVYNYQYMQLSVNGEVENMAIERIIGIDFGTSTSVIRVKRYEDGKPVGEKLETKEVVFSGLGATVPTLIQKKDDDKSIVYYGYEAQQKRKKTTTYHSFKVDLESSDPEKRALARNLTEEFFCYLAKTYKAQSEGGHLGEPGDKERTIVSYPVKWGEETRQFMVEAAQKAGFPNVTGMDEAQAAIQAVTVMSEDHLRKNGLLVSGKPCNILLIDMGAGTTDLVLCRYTPGAEAKAEILSTWPKDGEILFGGREVDSLLQEYFRNMMDEESANLVFRRVGLDKFKIWKENTVSPALDRNDSVTDFEPLDNQIEDNDIDMEEYCLDRASFEKCLEVYLKQLPKLINGCIDNSEIKASDMDLVIVTGGHGQWYFVNEMLAGKMPKFGKLELAKLKANPSRIISIARPQETVALGMVYSPMQVVIHGYIPTPDVTVNDEMVQEKTEEWYRNQQGVGHSVPRWVKSKCIQCNNCSYKCIYGAIRPFALSKDELNAVPSGFIETSPIKAGKGKGIYQYSLAVASLKCVSCGTCIVECPTKALEMVPQKQEWHAQMVFDYLHSEISEKKDMIDDTVKGSQFRKLKMAVTYETKMESLNLSLSIPDLHRQGQKFSREQRWSEAIICFQKAAEQGYTAAQYHLGSCYEHGYGTDADVDSACKWYRIAASKGHVAAADRLEMLNRNLQKESVEARNNNQVSSDFGGTVRSIIGGLFRGIADSIDNI